MVSLSSYTAFFTPGGTGYVIFKLIGEAANRQTAVLSSSDLSALLALFALGNVTYDPAMDQFATTH